MNFLLGLAAGGALGALTAWVLGRLTPDERTAPLAVLLGLAAGIYVGYGLADGRIAAVVVQILGAVPFLLIAMRWPKALGILGAGWIAHGLWDAVHELGVVVTATVPSWYPAVCLGIDLAIGGFALSWARLRSAGPAARPS